MAGMGIGIGAFMDGFTGGMRIRQGMDDRTRRQKLEDEDRAIAAEDRKRRNAREDEQAAFVRKQRARQEQEWADEDGLRNAFREGSQKATQSRNEAVQSAMQPIEAQGPTQDGRALPAWKVGEKTFADEKQARSAAEVEAGSHLDHFLRVAAPKISEQMVASGRVKEAQAFQAWIKDGQVQEGVKSYAQAVKAAHMGDPEAFADNLTKAFNNNGYFADGRTAKAKALKDKDGNITGMDLTIRDPSGKETTERFDSMEDVYRLGIQFMSPQAVFEHGLKQLQEMQSQKASIAKERRLQQYKIEEDTNKALLKEALDAASKQGPQALLTLQKRVNAAMSVLMQNDPKFGGLPDDQKAARAMAYLKAQDDAVSKALPGSQPWNANQTSPQATPPAAKGVPLWMPQGAK